LGEVGNARKGIYLKNRPSVQRTMGEKRDHPVDPVPGGMIRRQSLTFLGTGSAAMTPGSARLFNQEHVYPSFWFDYTDPEGQTTKMKEQITQERAERLARVKRILATSTRQDWEADGPRLWVCKGATELRIVDLTDDDGRVEFDEEWARSAGAGPVALRVELSICDGSELLAKVPAVCVDSGRAFIPWPREDEHGRLVVARWQYDLCRVISPGEYLGAYPVRSYLQKAGIVVI
jgi:hypothetical protein